MHAIYMGMLFDSFAVLALLLFAPRIYEIQLIRYFIPFSIREYCEMSSHDFLDWVIALDSGLKSNFSGVVASPI